MPVEPSAKLLIVDDEAPQMQALCDTLRDHGYLTTGFTSAGEALAAMRNQKFDLLLTDLMMPEMDGIGLLRAALKVDGDLACVMMTGHGTIDTAVEAMRAGALDYILKPFKLSMVLPVLARALTIRKLRLENAALERRVRERTDELEAANKELEAFSYSVSHDLRAPLRAMSGFSHILVEDYAAQMPAEAQHLLDNVCKSARRMEQLIEDLLQFSRMSRQPLSKRSLKVSTLVREVIGELRKEQPNRNIEVQVCELPDCCGDPSLLRQVFVNLLSNAFKFTLHREKAWIQVGHQQMGAEAVYFVRDNGAGFDMHYAEKLFGVFQRFHSSGEFEGTGVGLSIAQRIVQRHNGRIWAEAQADKGASFYFTLPD